MKPTNLREMSEGDLKGELIKLLKEQFNLRIKRTGSQQSTKSHLFKKVRLNIARIKTILKEKGLAA